MLSENTIKELITKYQTTEVNIAREYFQHLFLSNLYLLKGTDNLAFKGGTALKIIYGSPRFSADIDFTNAIKTFHLKQILKKTVEQIGLEGLDISILESKETSGGFLSVYETVIHSITVRVELNISMRQRHEKLKTESHLVTTPMHPAYTIVALDEGTLVEEKMKALITRQKPRDIFDLYFILKNRIAINKVIQYQSQLLKIISKYDKKSLTKELKIYLPKSYWKILTNFTGNLTRELNRL